MSFVFFHVVCFFECCWLLMSFDLCVFLNHWLTIRYLTNCNIICYVYLNIFGWRESMVTRIRSIWDRLHKTPELLDDLTLFWRQRSVINTSILSYQQVIERMWKRRHFFAQGFRARVPVWWLRVRWQLYIIICVRVCVIY